MIGNGELPIELGETDDMALTLYKHIIKWLGDIWEGIYKECGFGSDGAYEQKQLFFVTRTHYMQLVTNI